MNKIALMILLLFVSMYGAVRTDTVVVSGPISGATLNTGNGANELYAMDQNVTTTSDVAFDSTRTRVNVVDSLKLGSGSYLKTYVEGSFPCTLKTSDVTEQKVGTIKYTIIGNKVNLELPFIYGTSKSSTLHLYCGGLTGDLDPGKTIGWSIPFLTNNGTTVNSCNLIYTYGAGNNFLFSMNSGPFTSSGSKGIGHWLYTTKTNIEYIK